MPSWPDLPFASAADHAACRATLRTGSRSFHAASLLLPDRVRAPAVALYAFCRAADDAVDLGPENGLELMRERLACAYAGRPRPFPVDRAFADVVAEFALPRALPEALFEGFAWDAQGRRYDELADLRAYAARVAGAVGAMMAVLMGVRDPATVARACALGIAMQLTNVARDIGEDSRAGRLYLPRRWLVEAGIDPEAWLARPVHGPTLGAVVQRLLREADGLYAKSLSGIAHLPASCRPAIHAARLLYAEIGREVERRGLDSVHGRATVPARRKLRLLGQAWASSLGRRPGREELALPEAGFLVEAVADAGRSALPSQPWWRVDARLLWIIDLFGRLERRQHLLRAVGPP